MKKIITIILIAFAATSITISCNDFLDVNEDPNFANRSTPALTLPAAIASTASVVAVNYNILGGFWIQYWTQNNGSNQYNSLDAYNIQQSTLNNQFSELYSGALNDYEYVRRESKKSKDWNLYLMATVMQCYTFQVLADLYDQIPFDEALMGIDNLSPHYRSGEQVYDSLIVRIDNALAKDLKASTVTNPAASDLLFGGNMLKWRQFANTLKLKIYLRQIYARPDVAEAGIEAMYNTGATFLSQDAAMTQFEDLENKSNPLYEMDQRKLGIKTNIAGSKTFMDFLTNNGDPRLDKLFIPNVYGQQYGLEQGNNNIGGYNDDYSRALIKPVEPVYFISTSESYFLQSEAAIRNLGAATAEDLYRKGIEASFKRLDTLVSRQIFKSNVNPELDSIVEWNVIDSLVSPGKPYAFPSAGNFEDKLKAVITQKWIAMAGIQGVEAFFERNRTGYPKYSNFNYYDNSYITGELVYPVSGVTGTGAFPKRLLFPQSERSTNLNTPPEVPITIKVWWDQKP